MVLVNQLSKGKKTGNKITCPGCGHEQNRKSKGYIFRCSQCGYYKQLKKFPDRRFTKNKAKRKARKRKPAKKKEATIPVSLQ